MNFTNSRVEPYSFSQTPMLRNDSNSYCFWGKNLYNYENYSQLQQSVVKFQTILYSYRAKDWSHCESYLENLAPRGRGVLKSLINQKKPCKSSDTLTPKQLYKITDWRHQIVQFLLKFLQANQIVPLDIAKSLTSSSQLRSHLNPLQLKEFQL